MRAPTKKPVTALQAVIDVTLSLALMVLIGAGMALGADRQVQIEQAHAARVVAR